MQQLQDFMDDLQQRDDRTRKAEINTVNYNIKCYDPYAMWKVTSWDLKEPLPEELKGSYTSPERLWSAVKAYEEKIGPRVARKKDEELVKVVESIATSKKKNRNVIDIVK